ncbi:MAG: hypothetical protein ACP5M9_01475 [Candidatus Micrarchaeia archaeon]
MKISLVAKKNYPELNKIKKAFDVVKNGKICIAIGGDGTFIKAVQKYSCPIILIRDNSSSSTGYYSDIGIDKLDLVIKMIKDNKYTVDSLGKKLEIIHKNKKYYAVNECYLSTKIGEVQFTICEVKNNKEKTLFPFVISGDGVIISGKIGSTAYNRSAGGPLLLQKDLMCITFINPDGPYRNSLVVGSEKKIRVRITKYDANLVYDNIYVDKTKKGSSFDVMLSNKDIKVIKLDGIEETLGEKLRRIIESKMLKA